MGFSKRQIETGLTHLRQADSTLAAVIDRVGPFKLKLERDRFRMLAYAILSQQISGAAARTIRARVESLVPEGLSAPALLKLSEDQLRGAGVSPQKVKYLYDLSDKVATAAVPLEAIHKLTDDEVIAQLVAVKGVGVWTAQMFLMFCLGRLDVFPHDDLGIRNALVKLYSLEDAKKRDSIAPIVERWRPYSTLASWYCWRSLELA